MWRRLVIILSAVVASIVVAFATGQAGVSTWLTIVLGAAVALAVLLVAAKLLHVRLQWRGWE